MEEVEHADEGVGLVRVHQLGVAPLHQPLEEARVPAGRGRSGEVGGGPSAPAAEVQAEGAVVRVVRVEGGKQRTWP